ncbi:MAG: creatininase family protein [Acidobacteriota bacterium]|nr:creatininase family protein [Acidobacteriota bacterium]MDQ5873285.1 creatininase family protein [Acidobacteriota bacterium]
MKKLLFFAILSTSLFPAAALAVSPGVHDVRRLAAPDLASLDRARTVFVMPIGMLEEHGPHLPVGSDSLSVDHAIDRMLPRLQKAFPDRFFVRMPMEPYGHGGANEIGGIYANPGTYAIRSTTLRSLVADVGAEIAQNGFRWILVVHGHASPYHSVAISDACDFVSETFKVTMRNVTSTAWADPEHLADAGRIAEKYFSKEQIAAIGMDIHAGTRETSSLLASHPHLVGSYKRLPAQAAPDMGGLVKIARAPGWRGYLSEPGKARADYGHDLNELEVATHVRLMALAIGGDASERVRYPDPLMAAPGLRPVIDEGRRREEEFARRFDRWLKDRKKN